MEIDLPPDRERGDRDSKSGDFSVIDPETATEKSHYKSIPVAIRCKIPLFDNFLRLLTLLNFSVRLGIERLKKICTGSIRWGERARVCGKIMLGDSTR